MQKNVLKPQLIISAGDMSGDLTSEVVPIQWLDNVSIQLNFTGTPTGAFEVQGSLDYSVDPLSGTVKNPGNWIALTLSPAPVASGSADQILLDLYGLTFPFIRVFYDSTSGSGSLDAYLSGKQL